MNIQEILEKRYNKYQLMPKLREEFSELSEDPFTIDALIQIYLHKQADLPTMVGLLTPQFGTPAEVSKKLLELVVQDLMDFDETSQKFIFKYEVSEDVADEIARYKYPLPMIEAPGLVTDNYETGYQTIRNNIILNGSIEGKNYFADKDICLDHINRANSVALCVNWDVVENSILLPLEREPGEDFEKFKAKTKQREIFFKTSVSVMEELSDLGNELYLTHRYDRRGRCYSSGYHVNTQGDDYRKSCLELHNKELVK